MITQHQPRTRRSAIGRRSLGSLAGLALLAGITVGCGDGNEDPTPTAQVTLAASTTATATVVPEVTATATTAATATRAATRTTGIAGVDTTLAALASNDAAKIKPLLKPLPLKCTNQPGLGGPPKCPAGVPEGTVLTVLGVGSGEGSYIELGGDSEAMVMSSVASAGRVIYSVYKPTATAARPDETPPATYVVITQSATGTHPIRFALDADGKIIYVTLVSAPTAAEIMSRDQPTQVLVPPL